MMLASKVSDNYRDYWQEWLSQSATEVWFLPAHEYYYQFDGIVRTMEKQSVSHYKLSIYTT